MIEVRAVAADPAGRPAGAGERDASPAALREVAGTLVRTLPPGRTVLARAGLGGDALAAFVEGLVLGDYSFSLATGPRPEPRLVDLAGVVDTAAVDRGLQRAHATGWSRDLANTPSDVKTPAWLGQQAERTLRPLGVEVSVRDRAWLREHGFGGVLAVGAGSSAPPRLIEARWRPRGASTHLVLVGKGITFDTGGLNIKRGDGMKTMKTDMSGGAAVLGALRIVAEQRLPVRVTALVPAAENSFGAASYRPGDVVRHFGGRTSEILNTDAEGRVVLADALAYAAARLRPDAMVDIATLTGAMKVALGVRTGGVFATDRGLAARLTASGASSGEPLWPMPLADDYADALHSDVADANNAPGNPGSVTAALFLRPFAGRVPWAHLDVAGPARATKTAGSIVKGATGFGARLLADLVAGYA